MNNKREENLKKSVKRVFFLSMLAFFLLGFASNRMVSWYYTKDYIYFEGEGMSMYPLFNPEVNPTMPREEIGDSTLNLEGVSTHQARPMLEHSGE